MKRRADLIREVVETPRILMINTDRSTISFTDGEGFVRKYATDGKREKHQMPSGTVETRTRWAGATLVLETTLSGAMKVTKTFRLEENPRRLVVHTEIGSRRGRNNRQPRKAVYEPGLPTEGEGPEPPGPVAASPGARP